MKQMIWIAAAVVALSWLPVSAGILGNLLESDGTRAIRMAEAERISMTNRADAAARAFVLATAESGGNGGGGGWTAAAVMGAIGVVAGLLLIREERRGDLLALELERTRMMFGRLSDALELEIGPDAARELIGDADHG